MDETCCAICGEPLAGEVVFDPRDSQGPDLVHAECGRRAEWDERDRELREAARLKAVEAWALAIRPRTILSTLGGAEPMPPAVAIDYVQDVCGDRDDAVAALMVAAAAWLRDRMPALPAAWCEVDSSCRESAGLVCDYLASDSLMYAVHLWRVRYTIDSPGVLLDRGMMRAADAWQRWYRDADRARQLCRELSAAAWP